MEALVAGVVLALVTWHVAKSYVPAWLPPIALRVAAALVIFCMVAALVRSAPNAAGTALCVGWLLAGATSYAVRRWRAGEKEREARRGALHAARMHVRRRAPPPGPVSTGTGPTRGGTP